MGNRVKDGSVHSIVLLELVGRLPFSFTEAEPEAAKQSNSVRLVSEHMEGDVC